jgi:hypothetical protein
MCVLTSWIFLILSMGAHVSAAPREELSPSPWEHVFVTARPHASARFRRAIERRALWLAEDAARELPNLPLEDALQLVHLYAERGSPKYEKAAMRWLERYLTEGTPRLRHFADVAGDLAKRASEDAS